jgi:excisionase family DNA binding protein
MTTTRRPPRRSTTEKPPAGRDLLSVGQAAERLGTPERFIRRLIAQRRIRFYRVGRYIRFDARDLDAFVGAGLVEPMDGSRR